MDTVLMRQSPLHRTYPMSTLPIPTNDSGIEQVEIENLMIADWAERINGRLYIQGGGWERKSFKGRFIEFAVVITFLVPWTLTNQQQRFTVAFESEDGTTVARTRQGRFTVGRPATSVPGQHFRHPFAATHLLRLPGSGAYNVVVTLNGLVRRSVTFYADVMS